MDLKNGDSSRARDHGDGGTASPPPPHTSGTRLRRHGRLVLFLLAAVGLLLGGSCYDTFMCVGKEQAVFAEFPHYGGQRVEWSSNLDGRCYGSYTAPATQADVLS